MSMRLSDKDTVNLRFSVGTRVECNCGDWKVGTVVGHFYTQPAFGEGMCVPYQIRLDDGTLIFAPRDDDMVIRQFIDDCQTSGGGGRGQRVDPAYAAMADAAKMKDKADEFEKISMELMAELSGGAA